MIVTVTMVLILVVAVVIPIIGQQSESVLEYDTAENTPDYKMSKGNSSYSIVITPVSSTDSTATFSIGGTSKTFSGDESMVFLWNNGGVYLSATASRAWTANVSATPWVFAFTDDAVAGCTGVTIADGTVTLTNAGGSSRTSSYSWILHPDDSGELGFFSGAFNVTAGESFYTVYFGNSNAAVGYGTVDSMSQLVAYSGVTTSYTVTSTASDTYDAVTSVAMTYNSGSVSPVGCIADVDYNESVKESPTNIVSDLVNIVPIVLVVGVIIMAIGYFVARRD